MVRGGEGGMLGVGDVGVEWMRRRIEVFVGWDGIG